MSDNSAQGIRQNGLIGVAELDLAEVLRAVRAAERGDFSARVAAGGGGPLTELVGALNGLLRRNDQMSRELVRVSEIVGREGRITARATFDDASGAWATNVDSLNKLVDDLVRPTTELARVIGAVADGDLSEKMALKIEGQPVKGEFLRIGTTVNKMVDQLSSFADEVTRVAREVGTEGKLGGQADVPGVAGTWKDLTESVNFMASNLTDQVRNIAQVATAVAQGDLSQKITADAKGEILELKDTINTMVDQLSSFADEVTRVAREVGTEGKLGGQAEVEGVSGTWRGLTESVNGMASNLTDQVRNIAQVTTAVAQGDLTQKITVDVEGEILELKDTINTMVDQLSSFADEVTRVAREVGTEGKLGGQAEVAGVSGTWQRLTENVNQLASNLTTQVRAIAEVSTAVTQGDLTRSISVEAQGEVAQLKDDINQMIADLRDTTIRTLQILSDTALAHVDMAGLTTELIDRTSTLFGADAVALLLRDDTRPGLIVQACRGAALPVPADGWLQPGEGILAGGIAALRPAHLHGSEIWKSDTAAAPHAEQAVGSLLVVPLRTAYEVVGLLLVGAYAEDRFDHADLELLTLAADRIATAIDQLQRFSEGRQLVATLQSNLLPDRLPHHPRLEFAARYLPSGSTPQIGGDWYDVLELDAERTAVMIGDVVGHGVRAATTMSELRNGLRAFAIEGHSPTAALHELDRVVSATLGPGMIATAVFLVIDTARGVLTVANAGHPPPALRNATGDVRFLEGDATPPLGVDDRVRANELQYQFGDHETLLLFTDGLVERRGEAIDLGLERLRDALATAPSDIAELCDHVLARMGAEQDNRDDVAMFALRLLPAPLGPLELTLPARPESVPLGRHRFRAWVAANAPELDGITRSELELVFSEACSNVVRHAYGPRSGTLRATAIAEADAISLEIRDNGRWRARPGRPGGRGLSLMRQLCHEVVIDRRPDGTTVKLRHQPGASSTAYHRNG